MGGGVRVISLSMKAETRNPAGAAGQLNGEGTGCAKVSCNRKAAAYLIFSPRLAEAWMVNELESTADSIPLCPSHAADFKAPVEWSFTDRRSSEDVVAPTKEAAILDNGRGGSIPGDSPPLVDAEGLIEHVADTPDSEEDSSDSFEKYTDASEVEEPQDISGALESEFSRTPLLARAFRTTQSLLG